MRFNWCFFFLEGSSSEEDLEARWQSFCSSMSKKLKDDPKTFSAPIHTFLKSYSKMNDSFIVSALYYFGKVPKVKAKPLQPSKKIVVPPAAIARRKSALGERRALILGPPPKHSRKQHEHAQEPCLQFPGWWMYWGWHRISPLAHSPFLLCLFTYINKKKKCSNS